MRKLQAATLALALVALASFASPGLAQPETKSHPGYFGDVMVPPAQEGSYGTGYTSTERMVERCTALEWSMRKDKQGQIRRYRRNYQTAYCLGWINSAMAFLNFHDQAGSHTLGVCMPEDLHSVDVMKVVLDYVNKNKQETIYNPSLLIYWALLEKYPCKG